MNEEVEQIKQNHPLVFPIIVSILTSILLGLLTNCIWEGIQQSEAEISIRKMQQELDYLISDQTNMHLIIDPDEPDRFKVYIYEENIEKLIGYIEKDDLEKLFDDSVD